MLVNKNSTQGGYFNYISEEDVRQIHMASLEILERTGVVVYDEEALKLLEEGGAFVDGNRVRIPNCMVKKAIASAPSKIAFCNVDGERRIQLYRNNVYYEVLQWC